MKSYTHILFGVLFGAIWLDIFGGFGLLKKALFASMLIIGALIPDIDNPDSEFGKKLHLPLRHRGALHSIWPALAFLIIALLYKQYSFIFLGLGLGFLSHIVADGLTCSGVCPFWPAKFKLKGPIRTGKLSEFVVLSLIVLYFLIRIA